MGVSAAPIPIEKQASTVKIVSYFLSRLSALMISQRIRLQ